MDSPDIWETPKAELLSILLESYRVQSKIDLIGGEFSSVLALSIIYIDSSNAVYCSIYITTAAATTLESDIESDIVAYI